MESTQPISLDTRADFVSATRELVQSALRSLILLTGGIYLAWYPVAATSGRIKLSPAFFVVAVTLAMTGGLALWLHAKQLLAAQLIWLAGLAAAIMLAMYGSQRAEIMFLYALLPLLAVVTVDWLAGVLVELLVIGAVLWAVYNPAMPPVSAGYSLMTVIGGAYSGLVGWVVIHSLLTVTQWSLFYAERAQENIQEAREQRLELKQTEKDLLLANRELARLSDRLKVMHQIAEDARRAKEEFVANVSHELRTPLNMIIGFSEMITQSPQVYGTRLPPALLADITAIQRNSQHLARLVNDVLDLSQIEAGRMAFNKEWACLKEVVDEAITVVRALFESKGLYLETEVPSDLPLVFCDSTRVRQVVINLLSNAGRFTERGGVRVEVHTGEEEVTVSVADTGPGIPPEDQERIFEPFQQLDSSIRRSHGGSGLGLSISRRFVETHGGTMWLESEVSVGTTIHFSLPLETPVAAAAAYGDARRWFSPYSEYEYRARTRRSRAPAPAVVPRFVLLEEGRMLQQLFGHYLYDAETVSVRTIDEALVELGRSPAQALIVNTPPFEDTPGLDQLTNLPFGTPAMVCWVAGEDEAARRLGVSCYLVKPVTRGVLVSALESVGGNVKTVLLADDDAEILQLFTRVLSSADQEYDVLQAKSGQRALSLLRARRPDVMVLDLVMSGMDGFQVLQEKGQDPSIRDIPVVVVSSRDPTGTPIVSDVLAVTRGGGLSARDLLACIQSISEVLSPSAPPDRRGQPERSAA